MDGTVYFKKRPCRVCRRWFTPNPRLKDRQKICGDPGCKREWHRRKCSQWNRNNTEYFKANYLQKKLEAASVPAHPEKASHPKSRFKSRLPLEVVQDVISIQHIIIIEYFGQLLFRRFQELIKGQVIVNPEEPGGQSPVGSSRGNRL